MTAPTGAEWSLESWLSRSRSTEPAKASFSKLRCTRLKNPCMGGSIHRPPPQVFGKDFASEKYPKRSMASEADRSGRDARRLAGGLEGPGSSQESPRPNHATKGLLHGEVTT